MRKEEEKILLVCLFGSALNLTELFINSIDPRRELYWHFSSKNGALWSVGWAVAFLPSFIHSEFIHSLILRPFSCRRLGLRKRLRVFIEVSIEMEPSGNNSMLFSLRRLWRRKRSFVAFCCANFIHRIHARVFSSKSLLQAIKVQSIWPTGSQQLESVVHLCDGK